MKSLVYSDSHLDSSTAGMRRIDDLVGAYRRIVEITLQQRVRHVFFLGDLADPDCGSILIRVLDETMALIRTLNSHDVESTWIRGNHDVVQDGSDTSTLTPLRQMAGAHVIESPTMSRHAAWGSTEICFLPYPTRMSPYEPEEFLQQNRFSSDKHKVVMAHCTGIDGVKVGSETRDMARGATLQFPLAECRRQDVNVMLCGHFHAAQTTESGIIIPGSLECLRFDEEHNEPSVVILEI